MKWPQKFFCLNFWGHFNSVLNADVAVKQICKFVSGIWQIHPFREGNTRTTAVFTMKWLNDAAKLRLNPQIPRKVDETKQPVTDWQLATFQNDYDPYRNPWMV